jgi:L-lactate dehydrogenase complex protein LldG
MSAREKILTAITANKPALVHLPVPDMQQVTNYDDPVAKFTATLESIGGKIYELQDIKELELIISNEINEGHFVLNGLHGKPELSSNPSAANLEALHKAYLTATIGIAENGAVWISESQMGNRLLPFICQHLVIALKKENIVSTMHHAYQQTNVFEEGFGVFIAGPSKTADIEQSLVIGAHGARSLAVYLLN